jgi:acyl carrier protein
MVETRERLLRCFSAVFPSLSADQIENARASNIAAWDSIASVTLFAIVQEEFDMEMGVQDMKDLLSFDSLLKYLDQNMGKIGA